MYKHILVPVAFDHDRDSSGALAVAQALADEGAKITALHVMEEVPSYVAQYLPEGRLEENMAELQEQLAQSLGEIKGVEPVVISGHPGHSIIEYAKDNGADCIVIASHRPGVQDWFLGSTAARVVRHASCAVHVCR
ncbi:MAG TPA: universal stress protein [Aliiroseovarius sp.]|nr:universal stress protein [Aliiroseovarius sp.]